MPTKVFSDSNDCEDLSHCVSSETENHCGWNFNKNLCHLSLPNPQANLQRKSGKESLDSALEASEVPMFSVRCRASGPQKHDRRHYLTLCPPTVRYPPWESPPHKMRYPHPCRALELRQGHFFRKDKGT